MRTVRLRLPHIPQAIGIGCCANENPRVFGQAGPGIASVFDAAPSGLQKNALLRIHQLRLLRRNVEKKRIELVETLQKASPLGVAFALLFFWVEVILVVPSFRRHLANAVITLLQVFPKRIKIGRLWKATATANDGDRLEACSFGAACIVLASTGHPCQLCGGRWKRRLYLRRIALDSFQQGQTQHFAEFAFMVFDEIPQQLSDAGVFKQDRTGQFGENLRQPFDNILIDQRVNAYALESCVIAHIPAGLP